MGPLNPLGAPLGINGTACELMGSHWSTSELTGAPTTAFFLNVFQLTIPAGVRGLEKVESMKKNN